MKRTAKIILSIALSLIGIGIILVTIGYVFGADTGLVWENDRFVTVGKQNEEKQVVKDLDLEAFQNLMIDTSLADVQVKEADSYGVEIIYYHENQRIDYTLEDRSLKIESAAQNSPFQLQIGFLGNRTASVIVSVPKGTKLDQLSVQNDYGDTRLENLTAGEISLYAGLGNTELSGVTAEKLELDNNSGEAAIEKSEIQVLSCDMDLGDLTLTSVSGRRVESMICNAGDIELEDCSWSEGILSLQNDLGDITAESLTVHGLTLKSAAGSVELAGSITGKIQAEVDLGDAQFSITGKRSDYQLSLDTDLGDISVDGDKFQEVQNNGENQMEIKADCGDIDIEFTE